MPELTVDAVRGLTQYALDAGITHVFGGAMIDERYWRTVLALIDDNALLDEQTEHLVEALTLATRRQARDG